MPFAERGGRLRHDDARDPGHEVPRSGGDLSPTGRRCCTTTGWAARFRHAAWTPCPRAHSQLISADIDNDSAPDLIWNTARGGGAALNRNGAYKPIAWAVKGSFALADVENRALLDVVGTGLLHRNLGMGKFGDGAEMAGFPRNTTALAAADFDGDGLTDFAAVLSDGTLRRILNKTATRNGWARVTAERGQESEAGLQLGGGGQGGRAVPEAVYRGVPLTFGLRSVQEIDTVRITWPNGLIQNETKAEAERGSVVPGGAEAVGSVARSSGPGTERASSMSRTCWGLRRWGRAAGDGKYFPVDHDEFVSIRGESVEGEGRAAGGAADGGVGGGELSGSDPADRGGSPCLGGSVFERQMEVAAVSGVPAVWGDAADLPAAGDGERGEGRQGAVAEDGSALSGGIFARLSECGFASTAWNWISQGRRRTTARC